MTAHDDSASGSEEGRGDEAEQWTKLGVRAEDVPKWKANGFGRYEAALAQADGFTPLIAPHFRHQLAGVARRWERQGLASAKGLRWHQAGFSALEAAQLLSLGEDMAADHLSRGGYDPVSMSLVGRCDRH